MNRVMFRRIAQFAMSLFLWAGLAGCETKAGTGALIGGAAGAGIGAIIGHNSHGRTAAGALIGGAVGAVGGVIVGNELDKNDRREEQRRREDERYGEVHRDRQVYVAYDRVSRDDVIVWTRRGMRDGEILDRIDRSGTVFHVTAADENQLRDAGVSEEVISEMKNTARH